MPVLVAAETPAETHAVAVHPLAARALERLEPYWPGMSASATA
jgi:hypothetical protein